MGRSQPSRGIPPSALRRDARSKRAKQTLNIDIPALLRANPRAQRGIQNTELISGDFMPAKHGSRRSRHAKAGNETGLDEATREDELGGDKAIGSIVINVEVTDTLQAAHKLLNSKTIKARKVAILNMASPLRPGGGFLTGAQAQEESLCMRTTLYPALQESFYRLPDIGGIYTEDVLVFRGWDQSMTDLPKEAHFYVDVITAAMPRFPDIKEDEDGQKQYANPRDRDLVEAQMRKVMSILISKRVTRVVLGAWGCGAYQNPVHEVAQIWNRVLQSLQAHHKSHESRNNEPKSKSQNSRMEIVFAINQRSLATIFAKALNTNLEQYGEDDGEPESDGSADKNEELMGKIDQLRSQILQSRNPDLKRRLEEILNGLIAQQDSLSEEA